MDKGSHCLTQLGPLNPLEECISQFSDIKVASQRCHMELFNEKLTKSTTFGDHNLVHSIKIMLCNKMQPCTVCHTKLWITEPCHAQEMSHFTIRNIITSCYIFDKHCKNYGSTSTVLHTPMLYSVDSWFATPREALPMLEWHPKTWHYWCLDALFVSQSSSTWCLLQRGQKSFKTIAEGWESALSSIDSWRIGLRDSKLGTAACLSFW